MTNQTQTPASHRTSRRASKTPAWKSALLASAIGTVLLGWGILGWSEATSNTQTQPNTSASQAANELTSDSTESISSSSSLNSLTIPSMPQAPIFRRAPARTRGS